MPKEISVYYSSHAFLCGITLKWSRFKYGPHTRMWWWGRSGVVQMTMITTHYVHLIVIANITTKSVSCCYYFCKLSPSSLAAKEVFVLGKRKCHLSNVPRLIPIYGQKVKIPLNWNPINESPPPLVVSCVCGGSHVVVIVSRCCSLPGGIIM